MDGSGEVAPGGTGQVAPVAVSLWSFTTWNRRVLKPFCPHASLFLGCLYLGAASELGF